MTSTYRLPEGWSAPEMVEDIVVANDVSIHRAGMSTTANGEEVCGSAADPGGPALSRAWFELLERVSGLEAIRDRRAEYEVVSEDGKTLDHWSRSDVFPESDAPDRWRYARSNGIALHADWTSACERAFWELAERDRVIRSWHGEIAPERLAADSTPSAHPRVRGYEWRTYSFASADETSFSRGVEVAGVFGFPEEANLPFVLGFAARPRIDAAVSAAAAEALQLLAFLWGEPLPAELTAAPPGPLQHLDTYQIEGAHRVVRGWLDGGHVQYATGVRPSGRSRVAYVDLTPAWIPEGFRVSKAVCREATPLVFGDSPLAAHLPRALRLHPIP